MKPVILAVVGLGTVVGMGFYVNRPTPFFPGNEEFKNRLAPTPSHP